jgi:hypothetical protein
MGVSEKVDREGCDAARLAPLSVIAGAREG